MTGVRQTKNGVVQTESGVAQTEIATSTTVIIDDFNDGSLADWGYNDGDYWTADDGTNTTVIEGTHSLHHPTGQARAIGDVANHAGPVAGETFILRFREDNAPINNHMAIQRGTDAPNSGNSTGHYILGLEHDTDPDSVILERASGGTKSVVTTIDWSHTAGTEYELRWHMSADANPVHTIEIEDTSTSTVVATINATDTAGDPTTGDGIGFFAHYDWGVTVDVLSVIR